MLKIIKKGLRKTSQNFLLKSMDAQNNYIQLAITEFRDILNSKKETNTQETIINLYENITILEKNFNPLRRFITKKKNVKNIISINYLPKIENLKFLNPNLLSEMQEINEELPILLEKISKEVLNLKSDTISQQKEKFFAIETLLKIVKSLSIIESLINSSILRNILLLIQESDKINILTEIDLQNLRFKHLKILSSNMLYAYNLNEESLVNEYSKVILCKIESIEKSLDYDNFMIMFKFYKYLDNLDVVKILVGPKILKIIKSFVNKILKENDDFLKIKLYFNFLINFNTEEDEIGLKEDAIYFFNQRLYLYLKENEMNEDIINQNEFLSIPFIYFLNYVKLSEIIISDNFVNYLKQMIIITDKNRIYTKKAEIKDYINLISLYNLISKKNVKEYFMFFNKLKAIWFVRSNFGSGKFIDFNYCFCLFFKLTISNFYTYLNLEEKTLLLSISDFIIENHYLLSQKHFSEFLINLNELKNIEMNILNNKDWNFLREIDQKLINGYNILISDIENIPPKIYNFLLKNISFQKLLNKDYILNEYIFDNEIETFNSIISLFESFNNLQITKKDDIDKFSDLIDENLENLIIFLFGIQVKIPLRLFVSNVNFLFVIMKRNNYFLNSNKHTKNILIKIMKEILNSSIDKKYFENSFGKKNIEIINSSSYFRLQTICLNFFFYNNEIDYFEKTKNTIFSNLKLFLKMENLNEFINILEQINLLINNNKDQIWKNQISNLLEEYFIYFHKKLINLKDNELFWEFIEQNCIFINKVPFYIINKNENLENLLEKVSCEIFLNENCEERLKYDMFITLSQFVKDKKNLIKSILKITKIYDNLKLKISKEEDLYFKIHEDIEKISLGLRIMEKRGLFKKMKKEIKMKFENNFEIIHNDYENYSDWVKLKKQDLKINFDLSLSFLINNLNKNEIKFEENFKIYTLEFDFFLEKKNILIKILNKNEQSNDNFDQNICNLLLKDDFTIFYLEIKQDKDEHEKEILEFIDEINY